MDEVIQSLQPLLPEAVGTGVVRFMDFGWVQGIRALLLCSPSALDVLLAALLLLLLWSPDGVSLLHPEPGTRLFCCTGRGGGGLLQGLTSDSFSSLDVDLPRKPLQPSSAGQT